MPKYCLSFFGCGRAFTRPFRRLHEQVRRSVAAIVYDYLFKYNPRVIRAYCQLVCAAIAVAERQGYHAFHRAARHGGVVYGVGIVGFLVQVFVEISLFGVCSLVDGHSVAKTSLVKEIEG